MQRRWRETIESDVDGGAVESENIYPCFEGEASNGAPLALAGLFRLWSERVFRQKQWHNAPSIGDLIPAYSRHDLHVTTSLLKLNQRLQPHSSINISIESLLRQQRGVSVIFGGPGSGKTSLLKQVVKASLKGTQTPCWLPLLCSLQEYSIAKEHDFNTDLLQFSLQQLGVKGQHQQRHWSAVLHSLAVQKKIKVLFLFDDFQRISVFHEALIKGEVKHLSESFNVIICATHRDDVASLRVDDCYQICRLAEREWHRLVNQYCRLVEQPERSSDLLFFLSDSEFFAEYTQTPLLLLIFCAVYLKLSIVLDRVSLNLFALYKQLVKQLILYQKNLTAAPVLSHPELNHIEKMAFEFSEANTERKILGDLNHSACGRVEQHYQIELKDSVFFTRSPIPNTAWLFSCQSLQAYFCAQYLLKATEKQLSESIDTHLLNPLWFPVWKILVASDQLSIIFWERCRQFLDMGDKYSVVVVFLSKLVVHSRSVAAACHLLEVDLAQLLIKLIANSQHTRHYRAALEGLTNAVSSERGCMSEQCLWPEQPVSQLQHETVFTGKVVEGRFHWQSLFSELSDPQSLLRIQPWKMEPLLADRGPNILKSIARIAGEAVSVQHWLLVKVQRLDTKLALWLLKKIYRQVNDKRLQRKIILALGALNESSAQSFLYEQLRGDCQRIADILSQVQVLNIAQGLIVNQFVSEKHPSRIRLQAINALSYSPENAVIYQLQVLARTDAKDVIKRAALKGLQGKRLLGSISWVVELLKNESLSTKVRAAAFELLLDYRHQYYPEVPAPLEGLLYKEVVIGLRQPTELLSDLAAKNSASFGPVISAMLIEVCESPVLKESTRIYIYQALAQLSAISAIPKLLQLLKGHTYPGEERVEEDALAWVAAQTIVVLSLEQAAQSKSPWVMLALADHCLRNNIQLISEKTELLNMKEFRGQAMPRIDFSRAASEQLGLLRSLCQYLLVNNYVSLTANNPKRFKPPLFDKPSPASVNPTNSVNINTGRKFLRGGNISIASANKILLRLQELPFSDNLC